MIDRAAAARHSADSNICFVPAARQGMASSRIINLRKNLSVPRDLPHGCLATAAPALVVCYGGSAEDN